MILTLKASERLGNVYLLTLERVIKYKTETDVVAPVDILNFLEAHYKGKYTECENHEFQEVDDNKLNRYISNIDKTYKEDEWSVGVEIEDEDFYKNREFISILIKLEPGEEKAFIATLKLYMGEKQLTYNVDE